jgi:hypothetical protein
MFLKPNFLTLFDGPILIWSSTINSVWPAAMPTPGTSMPLPDQRIFTIWEIRSNTSALCDAIPVMWQTTDVQVLSLLGETTTAASTTIVTTNVILSSRPSQTGTRFISPSTAPNSLILSNGGKFGIGLVVPIVMLALLFSAFFYFRGRKKAQKILQESHNEEIEWDGLDCRHKPELPSEDTPLELDATRETMELKVPGWCMRYQILRYLNGNARYIKNLGSSSKQLHHRHHFQTFQCSRSKCME